MSDLRRDGWRATNASLPCKKLYALPEVASVKLLEKAKWISFG